MLLLRESAFRVTVKVGATPNDFVVGDDGSAGVVDVHGASKT